MAPTAMIEDVDDESSSDSSGGRLESVGEVDHHYFRTFINSIPTLAWSARRDGWIEFYNDRWYSYTGSTPQAMMGWGWESLHHPAELPKVQERWKKAIDSGEPFEMSFPLRRADGVFRWHLTRVVPVRDRSGAIERWFGTNTDVDDIRQTELRLAESLRREQEAREEAERARRLNEMFVGILGHDLRNPLSAVAIGASYLLRTVTTEKEIKAARRIVSSTGRMARMIDQLLDYTRIGVGGGLTPNRCRTDLQELCERVVEELEAAHPESVLALHPQAYDATGHWDSDLLVQALSNLVGNAIEHGAAGRPIAIRVECGPDRVSALVHNEGRIAPELLPVLFEPFRGRLRHDKRGLGLGLYIAQQIALAHGGSLGVTSSEKNGTTFSLEIPRAPPATSTPDSE